MNERLYNLFVGLPYKLVSNEGDMNYRLKVMPNQNNLVPRNIMLYDPVSQGQIDYIYTTEKFVQMYQEVSSIALWNPVASIIVASSLLPIQSTQTSLPKDMGNNNNFKGSGNNSNLLSAITDFTIAVYGNNQ